MSKALNGKRALVTGALGAFGAQTVAALRAEGADVLGVDLNVGPGVLPCDITDPEQVERTVAEVVDRLGGLDILVNCAGIGIPVDAGAMPGPNARSIMDVNLWGQWQMTAAALPALLASRGRVIFVASGLAYANIPFAGGYAVSKRALAAYADALRIEYGDHLDVTTVYPGYVPTPIHQASDEAGLNVGNLVRSERTKDIVATILRVAKAAAPPRDKGTTRLGHLELLAARHLPTVADRVVTRRYKGLVDSGRYAASPLVRSMRARVAAATGAADDDTFADKALDAEEDIVLTADGVRLRVRTAGSPEADSTVVFLHGWSLSQELWDRQWAAFSGRPDLRLISYDVRGHGRSGPAPDGSATIDRLAEDLDAVLTDLKVSGSVVLVGQSMGGMTALALARRRPELFGDLVRGLVLVNTSALRSEHVSLGLPWALSRIIALTLPLELSRRAAAYRRRGGGAVRPRVIDSAIARWLLFGDNPPTEAVKYARQAISTCAPTTVADFRLVVGDNDQRQSLRTVASLPVEILGGTRDRLLPAAEHSRALSTWLPDARLTIAEGAGHMLPLECPELVTDAIRRMIDSASLPRAQ